VSTPLNAGTNNQANHQYVSENPDEEPIYAAISSDVAIQTAKPKTVEEVVNLEVGNAEGNRKSRRGTLTDDQRSRP
jgi:hypothetical protein